MKLSEERDWDASRDRIIGLGTRSVHKNYYPALCRNIADLKKMMLAIEQTTVGIVMCNPAGVIEFANSAMATTTGYEVEEMIGQMPSLYQSGETPPELYREMWGALNAGQPWRGELMNRRKDGQTYWIRLAITPIREETGIVSGFVGINEDITSRIKAEERQALLIGELNHRVKNTLAVTQSIACHTLRTAETPQAFCTQFEARLMTLSHAHNLLNRSAWRGALLNDILGQELAPYAATDPGRFVLEGEEVHVNPNSAVTLSMAFHELATNAAKYGAFSQPSGRLEVRWGSSTVKTERRFHLEWRELGGPPIQEPSRKGFGMSLLERGLAHQLGGKVQLHFPSSGMRCLMDLPLDRLEARGAG